MARVDLTYFRTTGIYAGCGSYVSRHQACTQIYEEVSEKRQLGMLPGLRANGGREAIILVTIEDLATPHLVLPPVIDDGDVTPVCVPITKPDPR